MSDTRQAQDIAVGILRNADGQYLIAQRPANSFGGGYWEFPGGKLEPGENAEQALAREMHEELGIIPERTQHLIRMCHSPMGRLVRLHIWRVDRWRGNATGREGQRVVWCRDDELTEYELLPGNRVILNALRLPPRLVCVTPADTRAGRPATPVGMLYLHAPDLTDADYVSWAGRVIDQGRAAHVLLDRDGGLVTRLHASGMCVEPDSRVDAQDVTTTGWLGLRVHSAAQLRQALSGGADFAILAQARRVEDWPAWQHARGDLGLPVYAPGDPLRDDPATARAFNAQGIAGPILPD